MHFRDSRMLKIEQNFKFKKREMTMENRKITIVYGSQTGTAQQVAEQIARQANCRHFLVKIQSMSDYEKVKISFTCLNV